MPQAKKRIVIIGAGPTGLGAAYRLNELNYGSWDIYEKNSYVGGLCTSVKDEAGFTWDVGLHVIFSNIPYFLKVINSLLKKDYYAHSRRSFIYSDGIWIPYPFQNNIKYLEPHKMSECLTGLLKLNDVKSKKPNNFEEWIYNTFGSGIAKHFMIPYNIKAWKHNLKKMSYNWIGERVSVINVEKIMENIINDRDDISWGLHNKFKYPSRGGSGEIFRRLGQRLIKKPHLNKEATCVDAKRKTVVFKDGSKTQYDCLINTASLDTFLLEIMGVKNKKLSKLVRGLEHTKTFIIGIGIEGTKKTDTFWAYFPGSDISFYRMTYSAYSPHNAPRRGTYSIMCEISAKSLDKNSRDIAHRVINDLATAGIIEHDEKKKIISTNIIKVDRSYPIPTVKRDRILRVLQSFLRSHDIYSRGRFGAWKYEIGNMDHSFMQGVEAVDNILFSKKETTLT